MRVTTQPSDEQHTVRLRLSFDQADLQLEYSLLGVVVRLTGCPTTGEPGSPALPQRLVRVALPPETRLVDLQVEALETKLIREEALPIAPLQPARAGILGGPTSSDSDESSYHRPDETDTHRDGKRRPQDPRQAPKPMVEPFPVPAYVPPDPERYAEASRRPVAQLLTTSDEGLTPVATISLNPVRLTADGRLELVSQMELILRHAPGEDRASPARRVPANIVSRAQAMRQVALTRRSVVNPDLVVDISDLYPILFLGTDYLIITDNQTWDAETIAPAGPVGSDVMASFQRLAAWKRQRGLRAQVVTLTDIVAGRYGDFHTGSRDLQEVIRQFLKMAQANWGVAWVLLGGDTGIVPVRRVAGGREGNINRQATNPPPNNTSYWAGSYLRMHVVNPGIWWSAATTNLLVRPDNGLLIPYDAAGTSSATTRGWYFTTDDNYGTRSSTPTEWVRVNGPASQVNADLQFLYEWNTLPTDLYYSSLVGPGYNQPGKHDWDLVGNGVYGQAFGTNDFDGINYTPTLSLGRAPVRNAMEADTFVDKVIAYEKFERPDGTPLDNNWPRRVTLVSENWGGRLWIGPTGDDPPGDNQYHHAAGQAHSLIKLAAMPNWDWSLFAYISESDVRLIPYRLDAASAGRGWYFARSSTNLTANSIPIPKPSGGFALLPFPSDWIVVYGAADELAPAGYIFNSTQLDGSAADQEQLRVQLRTTMPGFDQFRRLYEDEADLDPAAAAAAPLEHITTDGLRDALNAGPHIVSLSGHGSQNGCCKLSRAVADSLTNGYHTFITYADSCLTNGFEGDAMSEHLLRNTNGGAVAYVGSTRFSWIGAGDDIQRQFFDGWSTLGGNAHLGLLFDTRAAFVNSFYWADGRWSVLSLNLMGDPEMPLWWREPLRLRIPEVYLFDKLKFILEPPDPNPPDPPYDLPYIKNWGLTHVHLRQGQQERLILADVDGSVEMSLSGFRPGSATLTVTRPGYQPVVQTVMISKSPTPSPRPEGWLAALLVFVSGLALVRAVRVVLSRLRGDK